MTTQALLQQATAACPQLAWLGSEEKNRAILQLAVAIEANADVILAANAEDMHAAQDVISSVMLDRLRLTKDRIAAMADGMRQVAKLPDPVGEILAEVKRPNGLVIRKTAVPMGVVAIIYESRPNVTSGAAARDSSAPASNRRPSRASRRAPASAMCTWTRTQIWTRR